MRFARQTAILWTKTMNLKNEVINFLSLAVQMEFTINLIDLRRSARRNDETNGDIFSFS